MSEISFEAPVEALLDAGVVATFQVVAATTIPTPQVKLIDPMALPFNLRQLRTVLVICAHAVRRGTAERPSGGIFDEDNEKSIKLRFPTD